jgi:hypothetical protein
LASCGGIVRVLGGRRQTLDSGTAPVANPQFAAERIFNIKSAEPLPVVRELGFANASTGILGICAFFNSGWVMPAAIVGGLFCGLAGVGTRSRKGAISLRTLRCIQISLYLSCCSSMLLRPL